ncbi:MAG: hypothetical protein QM308_04700 [Bacillota bacterium]|nr:hypothetical protein [Bacillota bacterium]
MPYDQLPINYGHSVKLQLVSNNQGYGLEPDAEEEIEQRLTILSNGQVWLSRYRYGEGDPLHFQGIEWLRIDPLAAKEILSMADECFIVNQTRIIADDAGSWDLVLTDEQGRIAEISGSLVSAPDFYDCEARLSRQIRSALNRWDLFVFDGEAQSDRLLSLMIDYCKTGIIADTDQENVLKNGKKHHEHIKIDRSRSLLTYTKDSDGPNPITMSCHLEEYLACYLLDGLDKAFFDDLPEVPDTPWINPKYTFSFQVIAEFEKSGQTVLSGDYHIDKLPKAWAWLMKRITNFLRVSIYGDILNPNIFERHKRRKDDLMFLSVCFETDGQEYTYLCDDESVEIGDTVLAPVGNGSKTAWVEVVDILWLPESKAPYPMSRIKKAIGKEPAPELKDSPKVDEKPALMDQSFLIFEPLSGIEPEDVRLKVGENPDADTLAAALAQTRNKTHWLSEKFKELPENEQTSFLRRQISDWALLESELNSQAFSASLQESRIKGVPIDTARMLSHQVADLLIAGKGYVKTGGWWEYSRADKPEINFYNKDGWHIIRNQSDIDFLFRTFFFRDSCIKEMRYDSGTFINRNYGGENSNKKRELRMILQSSKSAPWAIEMVFGDLDQMYLNPVPPDYSATLRSALMTFESDQIVWFDRHAYLENYQEMYVRSNISWIRAGSVKWREREEYAGREAVYINRT